MLVFWVSLSCNVASRARDSVLVTHMLAHQRAAIAADLEELARTWREGEEEVSGPAGHPGSAQGARTEEDAQVRHRRTLAEPLPQKRRPSPGEEQATLRAELGLPP
jgi:hypothetical protein